MARLSNFLLVTGIACVLMIAAVPLPVAAGCLGSGQPGRQQYARTLVNWFCSNPFPPGEWSWCWKQPGTAVTKWYLRSRNSCGNNMKDPVQCRAALNRMINCDGSNGNTRGGKESVGCVEYVADPNAGRCP